MSIENRVCLPTQADFYRLKHNDHQLYVFLMRFARWASQASLQLATACQYIALPRTAAGGSALRPLHLCSLIVETIPRHKDFRKSDRAYIRLRNVRSHPHARLRTYAEALEQCRQ